MLEFDLLFSEGRVKLENFGDECSLYRVFQNEIGERVLKQEKADFFLGDTETPLDNAYDAISIYLESGRSDLISEFSFETVRPTMLNLLQVKRNDPTCLNFTWMIHRKIWPLMVEYQFVQKTGSATLPLAMKKLKQLEG